MTTIFEGILRDIESLRRDLANVRTALRFNRSTGSVVMARDMTSAAGGSFYVAKAAATLYYPMVVPASGTWSMTLYDPPSGNYHFANSDICRVTALVSDGDDYDTKETWFTVSSRTANSDNTQTYTCTYQSGDKGWTFPQGVAVVDYGASGQGFLVLTADGANSPRYSIYTHAGAPWTTITERGRFGNMNGAFGVASNYYGFGVGDYAGGNYLAYDTNGGFRIKAGAGTVTIDTNGIVMPVDSASIKWGSGSDITTLGVHVVASRLRAEWFSQNLTYPSDIRLWAAGSGGDARITLQGDYGAIVESETGDPRSLRVTGGLNLGTSIDAATGNIEMSGSIKESTAIGARVYRSTDQTLTTATLTPIAFDSERFDTDAIHDTGSNTERLTCKTAGVYVITGTARFASNATGNRRLLIRHGGSTYIAESDCVALSSLATTISVSTVYSLAVNEYVELVALQSSGGDLAVSAVGNVSPEFGMVRIA